MHPGQSSHCMVIFLLSVFSMRERIRGHKGLEYDRYKLHLEIVDVAAS